MWSAEYISSFGAFSGDSRWEIGAVFAHSAVIWVRFRVWAADGSVTAGVVECFRP